MRKFIVSILAIFYLAVSTGVPLYAHYCQDQLIEAGLSHNNDKTCGNCGMEKASSKKSGCCKDEHKLVKLNKDQKTSDASFQFLKLVSQAVPVSYFETSSVQFFSITEANPTSNAPPQNNGLAIYKRNCVFRI